MSSKKRGTESKLVVYHGKQERPARHKFVPVFYGPQEPVPPSSTNRENK